jgi:tRNA(Ile)-lysidine synthase
VPRDDAYVVAADVLGAARASGLVVSEEPLLVMLSGGADSICLLDVTLRLGAGVSALHVNYGLREEAAADEAHCVSLCASLDVPLEVERVRLPEHGNTQALARDARYAVAERRASRDYAAAHTATDQAETVLYRLAASPGRRALLGMEPRRGRLVRPLLRVTREETRAYCRDRGLAWREDASNEDRRYARARVRHDLLPALRSISPAAERTIAETALLLRDESEVLDGMVGSALEALGGGPTVELDALRGLHPALARLVLRELAERAAGKPYPVSRAEADAVLALGGSGSRSLDLGAGLRAVAEYDTLRFRAGAEPAVPDPVPLPVPGRARFGAWEVEAVPGGGEVLVSPDALGGGLTVRSWREGDRMRPVGVGGSKTVADLFTDRKVPRALRRMLPVVEADDGIVWVAGVALDERFAANLDDPTAIGLSAHQAPGGHHPRG